MYCTYEPIIFQHSYLYVPYSYAYVMRIYIYINECMGLFNLEVCSILGP